MTKKQHEEIGKEIKKAMIDQGIRRSDLSEMALLSEQTVSAASNGHDVSTETLRRIQEALNIKLI